MRSLVPSFLLLAALLTGPLAVAQSESAAPPARLLTDLITGPTLWDTTTEQFETQHRGLGLQWLSDTKDQARFFGRYAIWDQDIRISEAIFEFQGGKLARSNLSLFNRGDSNDIPSNRDEFEKKVEALKEKLTAKLGVKPAERGKDTQSAVKAMGWVWVQGPTAYLLEYSYMKEMRTRGQEFRPEFIRLRVAPVPKPQGLLGNAAQPGNQPVSKSSLSANVTREDSGDVVIKNVPMVDQGPKGYCAVATTERVFRYYGLNVDQHEMAQIANTSQGGGTSPSAMMESLQKIQGRLRVRVRALQEWSFRDFQSMVGDYNREAKRQNKREVDMQRGGVVDIGEIYSSMDPASLKTSRVERDRAGYSKFQRMVSESIERGVPIMWGVQLGLFKEGDLPQSGGGHMRLIIGYNTKTQEILFSDSWGADHALKKMPMDEAYSITTGMYYIEPMK